MFTDIKSHIDDTAVRQIVSAAVFDNSEDGLNKWAEKVRSRESRQLYAWIVNDVILGVCDFEAHSDFIEILTIAVAESSRKRGTGNAMVTALQNMYHLPIEAETDDDTVEFYRKCGFEATAIRKYDIWRYTCVLPASHNVSLTLRPVEQEQDFVAMLAIESAVATQENPNYTSHPSHLVFDRYLYGSGSQDVFTYGKLVVKDMADIGYVLAYLAYPDETEFVVRLLPQYSAYYMEAVKCVEDLFSQKNKMTVITNNLNIPLCEALNNNGFVCGDEERWQSGLNLTEYRETEVTWQNEIITALSESDIDDRVTYADIPTGKAITRNMYETLIASEYYNAALDYVIRNAGTNEFIGFVTWWIDEMSKTATLEPVACLPEYRRRGIMKRALLFGLNELKRRGLQYAYVSTSIRNEKSQPLYKSVGFQKIGAACRWIKERNV